MYVDSLAIGNEDCRELIQAINIIFERNKIPLVVNLLNVHDRTIEYFLVEIRSKFEDEEA